jgi:hypothetical protein
VPIIIPIHDAFTPEITVEVVFVDSDVIDASPEVTLHALITFHDADVLVVTSMVSTPVHFVDTDTIEAIGRLNNEANRFGEVHFEDTDTLIVTALNKLLGYVTFVDTDSIIVNGSLIIAESFGFTIFVDITDAATQTALSANIRRYRARLIVDGLEIPIIRAELQSPTDKLGTELTVVLAEPNVNLITVNSVIDFDIAIWLTGSNAWQWINLLTGGKLSQRAARYLNEEGLPKDSVEISIVDIIGDRWNRAPRQQVFMYDSQLIETPSLESVISETIYRSTNGSAISPSFIPIAGMTLRDVLSYAYVTGCGFTKVVTNIENFHVEQASFTMTGGYDAGVRGLLEMFSPVVFASGNDLWIIDPDQPLPVGISAVDFVAAFSASIDDTFPGREPVNGMLIRVNDALAGVEFFTERLETNTVSSGTFGVPGFTEIDTERRIREYRTFGNPTTIVREEVFYTKTRTLDYTFAVISEETRTDHFDQLNRPTGYSLTNYMLLPDVGDPDLNLLFQEVLSEEQLIVYIPDPLNPLQDIQSRIETRTNGLILVDGGTQYLGKDYKIPYIDAHKSGYISGSSQTSEFGPVKTVVEQMTLSGGQVRYETRVTNHLADIPDKVTVKTLPGSSRIDRRNRAGGGSTRTILLTVPDTDSVSRRVAEFDASQLPYNLALAVAQRRLNNLNNPPKELAVNMSHVNPSLRKGAVIHVQGRSGYLGNYIIKGSVITIETTEQAEIVARMNVSARELR